MPQPRTDGEDCFLIKVHAATINDLEQTLDRFLTHGQTVTSFVVSTPVLPRPLPVEEDLSQTVNQHTDSVS